MAGYQLNEPNDSIEIRTKCENSKTLQEVPEAERLRLRRYSLDDERALYEMFADPYARTFYPKMADPNNVRAWIEWNLRNYDELGFGLWAVELKVSGEFIGDCGLTYQDVEGGTELEIGYHVIWRERAKGYATEAARACLDFGFSHAPCESICSIVRPSNIASCAVAAHIHTARRDFMKGGSPAILYYTKRVDWQDWRMDP
jgi:RimJ/RimL family protein N-acetyltransferase